MIARQVGHLSHLIDDLLDVERVVSGRIRLNRHPLDMAEAVRHAVAAFTGNADLDRRIEVRGEPVCAEGDAVRLEQVFANTVTNAHPDVAIFDIGLPDLDGYQVARRIRAHSNGSAMVLLAVTGYGSLRDHERSVEVGFDHHLVKPVDTEELGRLLDEGKGIAPRELAEPSSSRLTGARDRP